MLDIFYMSRRTHII